MRENLLDYCRGFTNPLGEFQNIKNQIIYKKTFDRFYKLTTGYQVVCTNYQLFDHFHTHRPTNLQKTQLKYQSQIIKFNQNLHLRLITRRQPVLRKLVTYNF